MADDGIRVKAVEEERAPPAEEEEKKPEYECRICLESATEPVVTTCGHLFCWPCIHRWLDTGKSNCPVCKGAVTAESLIPLYVNGSSSDPRKKSPHPPRPQAQRRDPPPEQGAFGMPAFGGMFLGMPFFGVHFNLGGQRGGRAAPNTPEGAAELKQQLLMAFFVMLIYFVITIL